MNGAQELIREIWNTIEDAMLRNKRTALLGAGAVVLIVAALFYYGSSATKEHGKEQGKEAAHAESDHKEGEHEETAAVHMTKEAQKAAGIRDADAVLEPISAPIEATAAIELDRRPGWRRSAAAPRGGW